MMSGWYELLGMSSLYGGSYPNYASLYGGLSPYSGLDGGGYADLLKSYYAKQAGTQTSGIGSRLGSKIGSTSRPSPLGASTWRNNLSMVPRTAQAARSMKSSSSDVYSSREALSKVWASSSGLVNSAARLTGSSRDSVFSQKTYDKDAAYQAVCDFAGSYNDTLDATKSILNSSVTGAGSTMSRITGIMSKSLSEVGVKVGADGRLSVDEEAFKNADESSVRSLFGGQNSYSGMISSSAAQIASQAARQTRYSTDALYGRYGYLNNYLSGSFFNSFF